MWKANSMHKFPCNQSETKLCKVKFWKPEFQTTLTQPIPRTDFSPREIVLSQALQELSLIFRRQGKTEICLIQSPVNSRLCKYYWMLASSLASSCSRHPTSGWSTTQVAICFVEHGFQTNCNTTNKENWFQGQLHAQIPLQPEKDFPCRVRWPSNSPKVTIWFLVEAQR